MPSTNCRVFSEKRNRYTWYRENLHNHISDEGLSEFDNFLKECERDGFISEFKVDAYIKHVAEKYFASTHVREIGGFFREKKIKPPTYEELRINKDAMLEYIKTAIIGKCEYSLEILSDTETPFLVTRGSLLE